MGLIGLGLEALGGGAARGAFTVPEARVLVEWRKKWTDTWRPLPDAFADSCEIHALSTGYDKAILHARYGRLFEPGETSYVTVSPDDWAGSWVRISLIPPPWEGAILPAGHWVPGNTQDPQDGPEGVQDGLAAPIVIFTGWVPTETEAPANTDASETVRGDQRITALGPRRILEQIDIGSSKWRVQRSGPPATWVAATLQFLPGFNSFFDAGGMGAVGGATRVRGNRAAAKLPNREAYLFGGTELWSHRDMLEYLVYEVLQQRDDEGQPTGPKWRIGGQIEILANLFEPVKLPGEVWTAEKLLREIVPVRFGCDAVILPTGDGWEIYVYSMAATEVSAGGYTLPANPHQYGLDLRGAADAAAEFEWSRVQHYDRVEVLGGRIMLVLSAGHGAVHLGNGVWTMALETAYKTAVGAGSDPTVERNNDIYRTDERFRDVYQAFALAAGWQQTAAGKAAWPRCRDDGELETTGGEIEVYAQPDIRRTLPRLPLREGYDYTVDPPMWAGAAGTVPEERPPYAVVTDPESGRKIAVDQLGAVQRPAAQVAGLEWDWGVRLRAQPNHAFARNHWTGANPSSFDPDDEVAGGVDYSTLAFTIAIESDYRVRVAYELPGEQKLGAGLTQVIRVDDAELHILCPNTIVGVKNDGTLALSPNALVLLRDDRDTLKRVLAGAIARYGQVRGRCSLKYRRLFTGGDCLGTLLTRIETSGGGYRAVYAPITSCVWDFQQRTTALGAGQAEREPGLAHGQAAAPGERPARARP